MGEGGATEAADPVCVACSVSLSVTGASSPPSCNPCCGNVTVTPRCVTLCWLADAGAAALRGLTDRRRNGEPRGETPRDAAGEPRGDPVPRGALRRGDMAGGVVVDPWALLPSELAVAVAGAVPCGVAGREDAPGAPPGDPVAEASPRMEMSVKKSSTADAIVDSTCMPRGRYPERG